VSGVEYVEAIAAVHAAGRKMGAFLTSYDVILSTTLAGPPPKLGYFDQNGDVQAFVERVTEYLSVTPMHNATGTPAMSVPLHWTGDGLPVGVHFAGRYGEAIAAQHSDRPYPLFMNVPGLKVVAPTTPADVKGLLKSAVRDNNPVVFFEDIKLWTLKGDVSTDPEYLVPLGKADVKRTGSDITIVAISGAISSSMISMDVSSSRKKTESSGTVPTAAISLPTEPLNAS